jgi:hypothetical protein
VVSGCITVGNTVTSFSPVKERGMRRAILIGVLLVPLGISACSYTKSYTKKRWDNFKEEVRKEAAKPRTKEGICQSQGGILYNEKCYIPNEAIVDRETCRIRGGLFLDEQCFFLEEGNPAL